MHGYRAMEINECLDGFFRDLEMRQFSQQHVFILEDQWNREVNLKLSHAHQRQQSKRTPTSGAQSSNEDVGIDNNLRCGHMDMVNRAASEGNVLSEQESLTLAAQHYTHLRDRAQG